MMPPLLPEAVAVTRGEFAPLRPAAEYRAAAAEAAKSWAQPGDSETVALARAVIGGSEIVATLYRASGVARALDDLDLSELVPLDAPDAANRLATWASFLDLADAMRAPGEPLNATVRRLLGSSLAVRVLFLLLILEPRANPQ